MRRLVAGLTLAVALIGCGDSTGPQSITGTYTLTTILGLPLPAIVVQVPGDEVQVTAGSLTLNSDKTWNASVTQKETTTAGTTTSTLTSTGTYSVSGNTIHAIDPGDDSTLDGSIVNGTLTVTDEQGVTLVFKK